MIKVILTQFLVVFVLLFFINCSTISFNTKTIKGKIFIKGWLPHPYVSLKVNSRLYYNLVGPLFRSLRSSYQGKTVILTGKIISKALGPKTPAKFEVFKINRVVSH